MMCFGYKSVYSQDFFYERSVWNVSGTIVLRGKRIGIGRGSKLCIGGTCVFGDHFSITGRSTIICGNKIQFGTNVLISWDVLLMDTDMHRILDENHNVINKDKPIIVGDNVWIGCRATILKGSEIPSNSIIAARAIVSNRLEKENSIYASDSRVLRDKISWER